MDNDLLDAAAGARERAHAPYSRYAVGAAVRTPSGSIHAGCNVENAAYPEGWCAETSALAAMVTNTSESVPRIVEVCVIADKIEGRIVTPCGGCRQRLAEFGGPDTVVHAVAPDGDSVTYLLKDLLPAAFAMEETGESEG